MSKSENVENDAPDKLSRDYAIWADVYYQDGSGVITKRNSQVGQMIGIVVQL